MFHVVLFEPEIPPNTGNIIRLCANTGSTLHLIHPLGFRLEDRYLRRAGMDYRDLACVQEHGDFRAFVETVKPGRLFACSTRGKQSYAETVFKAGDGLLFGPETRGLPQEMLDGIDPAYRLFIPMIAGNRSLNLSNAVAVVLFEAWRQSGFAGSTG